MRLPPGACRPHKDFMDGTRSRGLKFANLTRMISTRWRRVLTRSFPYLFMATSSVSGCQLVQYEGGLSNDDQDSTPARPRGSEAPRCGKQVCRRDCDSRHRRTVSNGETCVKARLWPTYVIQLLHITGLFPEFRYLSAEQSRPARRRKIFVRFTCWSQAPMPPGLEICRSNSYH